MPESITTLRKRLRHCPSIDPACLAHTCFKREEWALGFPESAHHPLLFDEIVGTRIMVVGVQPGYADNPDLAGRRAYLEANANQSPLGWFTGRVLTEWLGEIYLQIPPDVLGCRHRDIQRMLVRLRALWPLPGRLQPDAGPQFDGLVRDFRHLVPLHGTNIVKCHTIRKLGDDSPEMDALAGECVRRYLRREIRLARPGLVITLGRAATDLFSRHLRLEPLAYNWAEQSDPTWRLSRHRRLLGKHEFSWIPFFHPGYAAQRPGQQRIRGALSHFGSAVQEALLEDMASHS